MADRRLSDFAAISAGDFKSRKSNARHLPEIGAFTHAAHSVPPAGKRAILNMGSGEQMEPGPMALPNLLICKELLQIR